MSTRRATTITAQLALQAARRGDALAVLSDEGNLSWHELADLTFRSSARFRDLGIAPGSHAALLCRNRPAYLVAWWGLANVGAVVVSLNFGLVADGLRYAVTQSKASSLVVERELWEGLKDDLAPVLNDVRVIVFDGEADLFAEARRFEPDPPVVASRFAPVSIIYTSGTTGLPKGVLNCHEAFLAAGREMRTMLDVTEEDRIMVFLPLFHANPQMYACMSALETGCALIIRPKLSVSAFFDDARRFGATAFTYVGTVLAMLTSRLREERRDHPITRCVGGGAPQEAWRAMEERFGIVPHELYGMTEIGGWVTGNRRGEAKFGTVGRPRPDVEVVVLDEEDRPVPPGTRGEIAVRPAAPGTLLLGYWDNPQATVSASRNLWFHTGDAGSFDDDGYLHFLGRMTEVIRRGGENISPTELETVLLDHPDIEDAAVVGVPDPIWGQEIKAVVVKRRDFQPASLRGFLDGRVPAFMRPRYVQFVEAIPRTETQKIQRRVLEENADGVVDLGGG